MTETWAKSSPEIPENHENQYVRKYRERCFAAGMSDSEVESDDVIRERYREARDVILYHSSEHLSAMRELLNELTIEYTDRTSAIATPEVINEMENNFPQPKLLPETESLVQYADDQDREVLDEDLREAFSDVLADYSDSDLKFLAQKVEHLRTNASLLTIDNIRRGGDRTRRQLRSSFLQFKQSLGADTDEALEPHIPFPAKLGLRKSLSGVLWTKFYETDELPDFPLHSNQEVLPVGEYGEAFTKKLIASMQLMIEYSGLIQDEATQLVRENTEQFEHTARGSQSRHDLDSAALRSLQEGVISLFQAVYLLTAERVAGYETGDDLFKAIVEQDLPKELAYVCPPGVIGPVTLIGKYIEDLLVVDDEEQIKINPNIRKIMLAEKKEVVASKVEDLLRLQDIGYDRDHRLPSSGRGCPVAYASDEYSTSGISELSQLAYQIFTSTK